jgi:hypothetical protein
MLHRCFTSHAKPAGTGNYLQQRCNLLFVDIINTSEYKDAGPATPKEPPKAGLGCKLSQAELNLRSRTDSVMAPKLSLQGVMIWRRVNCNFETLPRQVAGSPFCIGVCRWS